MTDTLFTPSALELAVLAQLPIGVAVIDRDQRVVVMNPAHCESLGLPPGSVPPGTPLEEVIRRAAHRGVFGPGDPEAQIRAQLRRDRSKPGQLRRRSFAGRSYDLYNQPLPDGGYLVCAMETTTLIAARTDAEATATHLTRAMATTRVGIAVFDAERRLILHNGRYAELLGVPAHRLTPLMSITDLLAMMATLDEFAGEDGEAFLRQRFERDRRNPTNDRRIRPNGQILDIASDPLPDGGWTVTITDVSALIRAEDDQRRRAGTLQGLIDAIPHGICVYGPDRRVTMFNPAYAAVMRDAPLAVGDTLEQVIRRRAEAGEYGPGPPEARMAAELAHDVSRPQIRRRTRPNGQTVDVRTAPMPDGGYVSVVTDVTQLVAAEQDVARNAREMAAMLTHIEHGIHLWSAEGILVATNQRGIDMLGLPEGFIAPGLRHADLLARMGEEGFLGTGPPAATLAETLATRHRGQPLPAQRLVLHGRLVDVRSEPVDGGGFVTTLTDVTERTAMEAERARRAAETASMLASIHHGISLFSADRRLIAANVIAAELRHVSEEDLRPGVSFDALIDRMHENGAFGTGPDALRARDETKAMDRSVSSIRRRASVAGQIIEIRSDPTPDGGFVVTHTDITERVAAQAEREQRAAEMAAMLASIRHGIVLWSADYRLIAANAMAADLMEVPAEMLSPGLRHEDLMRQLHAAGSFGKEPQASVLLERFIGYDRRQQMIYRRRSGHGRTLDIRSDPTEDGGFIVTSTDVTSLVQAEADLARRAGEMEAMLANIRHGILLWSADRRLIAHNAVAGSMLGATAEILTPGLEYEAFALHRHATGMFGTGADADAHLRRLISHDRSQPLIMHRHLPPDREIEIRSEPTADGGFVITLADVTEARRTEAVLRQANEAAEAAAASKARFLATMSHELRTPLNAIIGYSDAIQRDRGGTDPTVAREYAEEINGAGKRLLLLINTLLDVARIEAGRFDLTTDRIDIARLVPGVIRQTRAAATAGEITVESHIDPTVPQLRGDERRMQQALASLVSNAIKFTEPGGSATIRAEREPNGDVLIRVSDTGIGIAEENLDRVFEPFTQLDPGTDRQFEGSGLGLYVARALVEAHGGTLVLRSRLGEGTTAEIRLPARRVVDQAARPMAAD